MSPLGHPVAEEADAGATAVRQARVRSHVLLPADPFRYEHLQRHHSDSARTEVEDELVAGAKAKRNETEDEESEEEEVNKTRLRLQEEEDDEEDEDREKKDVDVDVEIDVEVDVCRDGDESNPSSPVDLTASSRCPSNPDISQFAHPRGLHHPFGCLSNGATLLPHHSPVLINNNGHHPLNLPTVYHLGPVPSALVCGAPRSSTTSGPVTTTTTTTTASSVGQGNKRGLAFSVENILDPNKFTGGRIVQSRLTHRRRRHSGSVHEGSY